MSTTKKTVKGKRGRKALPGGERKDRLIQTRVADDLDHTLREEAKKRRLSVSQLIRNVLEDTFELVGDVVNETAKLAQTVRRDAARIRDSAQGLARANAFDKVESWHLVILSGDTRCSRCKADLSAGEPASMGVSTDPSFRPVWICESCRRDLDAR
jgi:hypothetical protein